MSKKTLSRKAFEAWANSHKYPTTRDRDRYSAGSTQAVWEAWQAASIHWAAWVLMTGPARLAGLAREIINDGEKNE